MSIRFREEEVNPMGRAAAGVRGIQLKDDDEVVSAEWIYGDEGRSAGHLGPRVCEAISRCGLSDSRTRREGDYLPSNLKKASV